MKLRRNLLTAIFSVLFVFIMGYSCFSIGYQTITESNNPNLLGGLLILGTLIFIIAAFLLKERGYLQLIQKKSILFTIAELLIAVGISAFLWVINDYQDVELGIMSVVLLFLMYVCGRVAGGRLSGIVAVLVGFFFQQSLFSKVATKADYPEYLVVLIVFAFLCFIFRYAMKDVDAGIIHVLLYIFTAVVFTFSFVINPFIAILFLATIFGLFFAECTNANNEKKKFYESGVVSAGIILVITLLVFGGINVFLSQSSGFELTAMPLLDSFSKNIFGTPDANFANVVDIPSGISFVIDKYEALTKVIYLSFTDGVFPTITLFFATCAGWFAIRKKSSYIGPIVIFYAVMFAWYIFYGKEGENFLYFALLVPVFAGYGFTNCLIEETEEAKEQKEDGAETVNQEEPKQVEKKIEKEPQEEVQKERSTEEQREEPIKRVKKVVVNDPVVFPEWHMIEDDEEEESIKVQVIPSEPEPVENEPEPIPEPIMESAMLVEEDTSEPNEEPLLSKESVQEDGMDYSSIDTMSAASAEESVAKGPENVVIPDTVAQGTLDGAHDYEQFLEGSDSVSLEDDSKLNVLLDRLSLSENIRRMNASAQEDMAEVIENTEKNHDLDMAIPADVELIENEEGDFVEVNSNESELTFDTMGDVDELLKDVEIEEEEEPETQDIILESEPEKITEVEPMKGFVSSNPYEDPVVSLDDIFNQQEEEEDENLSTINTVSNEETEEANVIHVTAPEPEEQELELHVEAEPVVKESILGKRTYHKMSLK